VKATKVLIREDFSELELAVPYRVFSFSEIRNGLFSIIERFKVNNSNTVLYYENKNKKFSNAFLNRNDKIKEYNKETVDEIIDSKGFMPWELISNLSTQINSDIEIYLDKVKWINKFKIKPKSFSIVGKSKNLHIHQDANIYPNVVFDVSSGPIVIDKDVKITPFSYLEGPLYIGPQSRIDNARITGGCIIGTSCRIGGEVENSIICDYTNKHHEGFLGHSFVGHWVNIGALATTSDLKNNYGIVKLNINEKIINTNAIKFGSIIGDFSKIGIGTMLNTGSVLDIGSNIVVSRFSGYSNPFTWLENKNKYRLDKFISDTKKIMGRRNQNLNPLMEDVLQNIYEEKFE
jgi:glucose-1-phosphate thymidylyltransferase